MKAPPCKDCPDRYPACSGSCEKYKEFTADKEKANEYIRSLQKKKSIMPDSFRRRCGFHKPK